MSRPRKRRRVCGLPQNESFIPANSTGQKEPVILSVDEYEAIRLIDKEGLSQADCGEYMQVARTTVQQIYSEARKKIAVALVDGRALHIRGGNYSLCEGKFQHCGRGDCRRHRHGHTVDLGED